VPWNGAPTTIVSPEMLTVEPNASPGAPSGGVSFCCCVQVSPDRTKTYAASALVEVV
jgi:hypothetical protein